MQKQKKENMIIKEEYKKKKKIRKVAFKSIEDTFSTSLSRIKKASQK